MTTPVEEGGQLFDPGTSADQSGHPLQELPHQLSSDEDGTLQGEVDDDEDHNHLRVETSRVRGQDQHIYGQSPLSPSQQRERTSRLDDDLKVLQAERLVSIDEAQRELTKEESQPIARSRSRTNQEPVDDFDISTNPIHVIKKIYQPPTLPATKLAKFFKKIHESSFLVRYFVYITPVTLLLLIPILLGLLLFKRSTVGGVELRWFGVWLEIVWLTLWLARVRPSHLVLAISID